MFNAVDSLSLLNTQESLNPVAGQKSASLISDTHTDGSCYCKSVSLKIGRTLVFYSVQEIATLSSLVLISSQFRFFLLLQIRSVCLLLYILFLLFCSRAIARIFASWYDYPVNIIIQMLPFSPYLPDTIINISNQDYHSNCTFFSLFSFCFLSLTIWSRSIVSS